MPSLMTKLFRAAKHTVRKSRQQGRTAELHHAGCRLLAEGGYEYMTISRLAKEAGISVGAFYERFPSKEVFLSRLIYERLKLANEQAISELAPNVWLNTKPQQVVRGLVEHVIVTLHGPGRGIVLAAMRRGNLKPNDLEPLDAYRANVSDLAVALLGQRLPKMSNPDRSIRAMVQIVHATALDTLTQDHGPLRMGHYLLVDTMGELMCNGLGLNSLRRRADKITATDDRMIKMPIKNLEVAVVQAITTGNPSFGRRRIKTRHMPNGQRKKLSPLVEGSSSETVRARITQQSRTSQKPAVKQSLRRLVL